MEIWVVTDFGGSVNDTGPPWTNTQGNNESKRRSSKITYKLYSLSTTNCLVPTPTFIWHEYVIGSQWVGQPFCPESTNLGLSSHVVA